MRHHFILLFLMIFRLYSKYTNYTYLRNIFYWKSMTFKRKTTINITDSIASREAKAENNNKRQ